MVAAKEWKINVEVSKFGQKFGNSYIAAKSRVKYPIEHYGIYTRPLNILALEIFLLQILSTLE